MYIVKQIERKDCAYFILNIHYAHRWSNISYAYGLFLDNVLVGIVTYGIPPSPNLRKGVAGKQYKNDILELNRLCLLHNEKNEASMLVGRSIRLLPKNRIIVSFADTKQHHIGYVYQAANFLYTGSSPRHKVWKIKGKEHLHPMMLTDEFRGIKNRLQAVRNKYGTDLYSELGSQKHRYVYIHGSHTYKKTVLKALKYSVVDYPK